jgi:hypothetical protein
MASYHLFAFTPFVDSASVQYLVGWSIIGVTTLNIGVNMMFVGYQTLCNIKIQIRKLSFKFNLWRHHKKQESQIS